MEADSYDRGYAAPPPAHPSIALFYTRHFRPRPLQSAVREPSIKLMRSFITEFQMFHCFVKCGGKGDKIPL